jgi:hypothetical protein
MTAPSRQRRCDPRADRGEATRGAAGSPGATTGGVRALQDGEQRIQRRAHDEHDDHHPPTRDVILDDASVLRYPGSPRSPSQRPSTALLPCCLPSSRLPCSSSSPTTSACRRPASRPPAHCLGCPARFLWQVEEGGSSAKRWTPLPRKPRREAKSRPGAGRRPGDLLTPPTRDHHLDLASEPHTAERWARIGVQGSV